MNQFVLTIFTALLLLLLPVAIMIVVAAIKSTVSSWRKEHNGPLLIAGIIIVTFGVAMAIALGLSIYFLITGA